MKIITHWKLGKKKLADDAIRIKRIFSWYKQNPLECCWCGTTFLLTDSDFNNVKKCTWSTDLSPKTSGMKVRCPSCNKYIKKGDSS